MLKAKSTAKADERPMCKRSGPPPKVRLPMPIETSKTTKENPALLEQIVILTNHVRKLEDEVNKSAARSSWENPNVIEPRVPVKLTSAKDVEKEVPKGTPKKALKKEVPQGTPKHVPRAQVPKGTLKDVRAMIVVMDENHETEEAGEQDVDDSFSKRRWFWSPEFGWFEASLHEEKDLRTLQVRAKKGKENRIRERNNLEATSFYKYPFQKKFWSHSKPKWYHKRHFGPR